MTQFKQPPAEGDIVLPPVDLETLNNGQLRLLTKASGAKMRQIRAFITWNEDEVWETDDDGDRVMVKAAQGEYDGPVDEVDLLWALGKLQLQLMGYEPSDENADRVRFENPDEDDTDGDEVDPPEAQ